MTLQEFSDLVRRCGVNVGVELVFKSGVELAFKSDGTIRGRVGVRPWAPVTDVADLAATFLDLLIEGAQKDRACALESVEKAYEHWRHVVAEADGVLNAAALRADAKDAELQVLQGIRDELVAGESNVKA